MKIGFSTMEKSENRPLNSVGSSRIRARWVSKYWSDIFPEDQAEEFMAGRQYDVLVFQKDYWRTMMIQFKGIKIFDICDPDWLEPRPVIESIELCDACTTSTPALANYIKKFVKDKPVICIPDRVDLEEHLPRGEHQGKAQSIVWFGYAHNANYLFKTFDFILENDLELTIISEIPVVIPRGFENMKHKWIKYNYESLHEELKRHDMVLLPTTEDDLRGSFKSNNKVLTAWALGLPVVQSADDLERFMDPEERNKERAKRLEEVSQKWDVRLSVKEYKDLIEQILSDKPLPYSTK